MRNYSSFIVGLIVLLVILGLGAFGIYQLFPRELGQESPSPSPEASPVEKFPIPSPGSPVPSAPVPDTLPAAGSEGDLSIKIFIESPRPSDLISSPIKVNGWTDITLGKIEIRVKNTAGEILGQESVNACTNQTVCSFQTQVAFTKTTIVAGTVEVYNLQPDNQEKLLQTTLVRFQ